MELVFWRVYSYAGTLFVVVFLAGLVVVPTYRIHRSRLRRTGVPLGVLARSIYAVPAVIVVAAGIYRVESLRVTGNYVTAPQWLLLLVVSGFVGLAYMRRAESANASTTAWVRSWPGWFRPSSPEPSVDSSSSDNARVIALPAMVLMLSLFDTVSKAAGYFGAVVATELFQAALVVGTTGTAVYALTALKPETDALGNEKLVLRFGRRLRMAALLGAAISILLWSVSASYEPQSDLRIVAADLPRPSDRLAELTILNKSDTVHALTAFHVESRTPIPFACWSADFAIPLIATYVLPFHVNEPFTAISAKPVIQFPPQRGGRIRIALKPNATGACAEQWQAQVRIAVVSEDGKRSLTHWFSLEK